MRHKGLAIAVSTAEIENTAPPEENRAMCLANMGWCSTENGLGFYIPIPSIRRMRRRAECAFSGSCPGKHFSGVSGHGHCLHIILRSA